MAHEPSVTQPVTVDLTASPVSVVSAEDASSLQGNRAVKRTFTDRDEADDESASMLQRGVSSALKESTGYMSMPVVLKDGLAASSGHDLQSNLQQMLLASRAYVGHRKRVCVAAH